MAKTYEQILDDWVSYMVSAYGIRDKNDIPHQHMERLIVAAKRHERFFLLYELNQMKIKDEEDSI